MSYSAALRDALTELSTHNALIMDDDLNFHGIRQSFMTRLLADADPIGAASSACTTTASTAKTKPFWGSTALSADGILAPFSSEIRRREDLYKAFAIAFLFHTVADDEIQLAFKSQWELIAKGSKAARRFSTRSRFRAAQGLFYLGFNDESFDIGLKRYLFCLSELLETRLQCSEESLV
jgi:hypothetical protein